MRLFARNGNDWTERYSRMVEAALRNRNSSFVVDGEVVLLGVARRVDGIHLAPLLEALVSKHRESPYRGGRFARINVKNRAHPAFNRVMDQFS